MDRNFQTINQRSNRPNRTGFVDLTLRLGNPNHNETNLTQIGQSLDPAAVNTPQDSFRYLGGSYSHFRPDQRAMQNDGIGISALSGGTNNIGNFAGYYGPNSSNPLGLGLGLSHNAILGQQNQTNSGATSDQVLLSSAPNSNPNSTVTVSNTEWAAMSRSESSHGSNRNFVQNQRDLARFNEDANRRCSNTNCGVTSTPMWRRGPLGPKSLCNACGIKYRKQVQKMSVNQAKVAGSDQEASSTSSVVIDLTDD